VKNAERRFVKTEVRASGAGEPSLIEGYAAVFDSRSEDLGWYQEMREEIDPHAFDNVLATNPDVRGLFNHDSNFVLGRTTAGTLRLKVDARGLQYSIDPPDTQVARDLMVSIRRKDITGSSFAFVCKRDQWTDNEDGSVTRRILEFDQLLDVSPVTNPAYPASSVGANSLPDSMPAEMRSRVAARIAKRDDSADANLAGCSCSCDECQADNCVECSDADCSDTNCAGARSLRNADVSRRIAIAEALGK
jgi:uncharacterized protein